MQKQSIVLTVAFLIGLSFFQSCKNTQPEKDKDVTTPESAKFNLLRRGDLLVFKKIEDYENVVNEPTDSTLEKFYVAIKSLRFKSFSDFLNESKTQKSFFIDSLINNDLFKSIINADLSIQIGDNIFRVNPETNKVYALPEINVKEYKDLISENIINKNIVVFSTDDDILELIREGNQEKSLRKCKESGIGSKHDQDYLRGFSGLIASAAYNKWGIFYSVKAEIGVIGSSGTIYKFDFTGGRPNGLIHYKIKCGKTTDYQTLSDGKWALSKRKYQSYQGSKPLNELYFCFKVHDPNNVIVSRLICIRQNW